MAKKNTAISDEKIIAAILSNGTFEEAAKSCGITSRTIRDRLQDPDFRADYAAAKNEILRQAVTRLNSNLAAAVDTVAEIMQDKTANPAIRLQAAQTILNNANKLADKLAAEETHTRKINMTFDETMQNLFSND